MNHLEKRIVVVGGGVIGVCCAYYLAKRGAPVTLLERDEIGKGASFGNAGTIAPGHGPINKPGRVLQAVKSLRDQLSPLYVAPRLDPALAWWLWQFARKCTGGHVEHCLSVLGPMGHTTCELFRRLVDEESLDCGYRQSGYYEVFRDQAALEGANREAALLRAQGYRPETLAGPAIREREAAINQTVVGAVFFPEAGTVDPYRFVCELAVRAVNHGATVVTGTEVAEVLCARGAVSGVRTAAGDEVAGDVVLLAAGAYTPRLTRGLGISLPLQPAKGYHSDRDLKAGCTPRLGNTIMLGEKSVFCTPMEGFVRFAGTLEFSGENHEIRRPRLEQLTDAAKLYLDGMAEDKALSEWCGLRPCVADGLPVIGPVPGLDGVFLATGHGMLGLTLAPVTGQLVADYILDGQPGMDLSAVRVDRF